MTTDQKYGPNTALVQRVIDQAGNLTEEQVEQLTIPRTAAGYAAWYAAWYAARTAGCAARAAGYAAVAVACKDLIGDTFTQAHYDILTAAWRNVFPGFDL